MAGILTVRLHVMDLQDAAHRAHALKILNQDDLSSIHQLDGSSLSRDALLSALNAFVNEDESSELSLEELAQISGGVGIPEALVSSTILMAMVAGASGLFSGSMGAVSNSQIQDALNAGVSANIENVRNELSNRFLNTGTGEYEPTVSSNLGADFLSTLSDDDGNSSNGIQSSLSIGNEVVQRTITADGNTIEITYTHTDASGVTSEVQGTTLVSPASGWLS